MADVKILLVEDENIEALDIKGTLEALGYKIQHIASRGKEAVKKARELEPDLILTDIILKDDVDGIEVASRVSEYDIPVIFLTAHSDESVVNRAKQTNPYGYILKPYDPYELKNSIELALYKHKMDKELRDMLYGLQRIQQLGNLYLQSGNIEQVFEEIVDIIIAICDADFGNIQLLNPSTSKLEIVAQRKLPKWWINYCNEVSKGKGTCGTALENEKRIIVEDVELDPIFRGKLTLQIQLKAGIRALQSTPIISRSGKPLGIFSTHYKKPHKPSSQEHNLLDILAQQIADIIEKEKSEKALRENENRFKVFMNSSPTISWMKDEAGRHVYLSQTYEKRFGISFEEWEGKTDFELWPADVAEEFNKNDQIVLTANKPIMVTEKTRNSDGSYTYWLNSKFPFQDESGRRYVGGVGIDITERKHAENNLIKSRTEFKVLIQNLESGVALINKESRFNVVNPAFINMFGLDSDSDIVNINNQDWSRWKVYDSDGELLDVDEHPVRKVALTGKPVRNAVVSVQIPGDNKRTWMMITAEAILDKKGAVKNIICTFNDITKLKNAEISHKDR